MLIVPYVPTQVVAQEALCAEVRIEIPQSVSLERQAFNAKLGIDNATDLELSQLLVNVEFLDEDGDAVVATSDPNNTTAAFFIRLDDTPGISGGLDGTGVVAARSQAEANWLIIPAAGTGGFSAAGQIYYVGATISYVQGGESKTVSVVPDTITVEPQPLLALDYFLPSDVYSDDPFTPIVEPPEPFTLGVRIKNTGAGVARRMRIDTAQPSIVDNQQGLLVAFNIEGSFVQNEPAQPTLLLDFGDIESATSKVGRWNMTTTLTGQFSEFTADFSHDDALGGALTSLIESVTPHELVKDVLVDLDGRDSVGDFLALDIDTYRTYESEGTDTVVVDRSSEAGLDIQPDLRYLVTFTPSTLQAFARVNDESRGSLRIIGATRVSDGTQLPSQNVWLSKSRQSTGTAFDYFLNVYDARGTGGYLIDFENAAGATLSGTVYRDLNNNGLREESEPGIAACEVQLLGNVNGVPVDQTATTNGTGDYSFVNLTSSTYSLVVGDMPGLQNGTHAVGGGGGAVLPGSIVDIAVPAGESIDEYFFAKTSTSPTPHADTSVVVSTLTPTVTVNEEFTVLMRIKNNGPDPAEGSLLFTLESGLTIVSVNVNQGSLTEGAWNFGGLSVQQESTLTLVAQATRGGTFQVSAVLDAGDDPDGSNNAGSVAITASTVGDLLYQDGFEDVAPEPPDSAQARLAVAAPTVDLDQPSSANPPQSILTELLRAVEVVWAQASTDELANHGFETPDTLSARGFEAPRQDGRDD
ncbi:MAG: SdrD B-like domain-containing protein [Lysobacterales bacterium]